VNRSGAHRRCHREQTRHVGQTLTVIERLLHGKLAPEEKEIGGRLVARFRISLKQREIAS
jgi:hypothetical protein